jgi:AraC family transcriptional regulator of adaptative response/methylated-DNA-[protein]-cysteine methyltransferase
MLFESCEPDELYEALLRRDPAFDGRVFVCVTTTGIFCRLTCPARKPKRENCVYFETVADCIEAGFRPCQRCNPLNSSDLATASLIAALENRPGYRWTEADIEALGFDCSTVRRAFKRQFGITFLEMARQRRLREGMRRISEGGKVIEAQIDAGFESASAFRSAFSKLLGQSPRDFSASAGLLADWIATPLGPMIAVSDRNALHLLEFVDRKALATELRALRKFSGADLGIGQHSPTEQIEDELTEFFSTNSATFQAPIALRGSPFAEKVWRALCEIPPGETRSYADIAATIGQPSAVRAVARANGANRIAIVVPCHRVIGADGSMTGYGGGLWRKRRLIELESHFALAGRGNQQTDCTRRHHG